MSPSTNAGTKILNSSLKLNLFMIFGQNFSKMKFLIFQYYEKNKMKFKMLALAFVERMLIRIKTELSSFESLGGGNFEEGLLKGGYLCSVHLSYLQSDNINILFICKYEL